MNELVGQCTCCAKPVYCKGGFLEGQIDDQSRLFCYSCYNDLPELTKKCRKEQKGTY